MGRSVGSGNMLKQVVFFLRVEGVGLTWLPETPFVCDCYITRWNAP